jgi:hypothetical protein
MAISIIETCLLSNVTFNPVKKFEASASPSETGRAHIGRIQAIRAYATLRRCGVEGSRGRRVRQRA